MAELNKMAHYAALYIYEKLLVRELGIVTYHYNSHTLFF